MNIDFITFESRLSGIRTLIEQCCQEANRDVASVTLLPVTKNHPVEAALYAQVTGIQVVGENRVQEAAGKKALVDGALRWELIGPLQSNKAKKAVETFSRIQTVDRVKLAKSLQKHSEDLDKYLGVLLQVNAGKDPNKSGVTVDEADLLLETVLELPNLKVDGLMTIAPLSDDKAVARRTFAALRECRDRLESKFGVSLPELSMGMSGDMKEAILEGSTMIRVGTALYGERDYA